MYSLDTSFFMDWQARHYPLDVFPGFAFRVESLLEAGQCGAVDLVREELQSVGTPELVAWTKGQGRLFFPLTPDIQLEGARIEAAFPDLMDPRSPHTSADAYVIAFARLRSGAVVTQETSAAEKARPRRDHFIPDVCRALGVPCFNLLGLARREGWRI